MKLPKRDLKKNEVICVVNVKNKIYYKAVKFSPCTLGKIKEIWPFFLRGLIAKLRMEGVKNE